MAMHSPGWRQKLASRLYTEHWRVGVIDQPLHSLLKPGPLPVIHWITPREHAGYWADPFGVPGDDHRLYCERFDERTGLGTLEMLELRDGGVQSLGSVQARDAQGASGAIGRGLHASFPNVFQLDGETWALPETGAARECVLYRVDAQGVWHSPIDLLPGVAAADPALFRWQGRYWLALTDVDFGSQDNLCLYHADTLIGPWTQLLPHPVKVDRGGARMAGRFFEHDGVLYRPGQDCRSSYGAAVVIYKVLECSVHAYRETPCRVLSPDIHGELPDGLHTLTAWGDRTLVDGKRMGINPIVLARKVRSRLSRKAVAS
jgi:hypothetical protein